MKNAKKLKKKVIFQEKGHLYTLNGKKLRSVTTVISKYFPYDRVYWLIYKSLEEKFPNFKELKWEHIGKMAKPKLEVLLGLFGGMLSDEEFERLLTLKSDEWLEEADKSTSKGTLFHKIEEDKSYEQQYMLNPFDGICYPVIKADKEYDNQNLCDNLYDLPVGYYPELLIWNERLGWAGQADRVWIIEDGGFKYVDIDDYKTGKKPPNKSNLDSCPAPFYNYKNCKHNKYLFQIQTYAGMLAEFGLIPRHLSYTYYKKWDYRLPNQQKFEYIPEIFEKLAELN